MKKDDLDNLFEEISPKEVINESSLNRIAQLAMNDGFVWGIVTAYRGENDNAENKRLQDELKRSVRKRGWGYREIDGVWQEKVGEEPCDDNPDAETKTVSERSLFIAPPKGTDGQEVKEFIIDAVKRYDQDAGIYKIDPEGDADVLLYSQRDCEDGEVVTVPEGDREFSLGKFHANLIGDNYSRVEGGRTFVFKPRGVTDGYTPNQMKEVTFYGKTKMICELTLEEANLALDDVNKRRCTSFCGSMARGALRNSIIEHISKKK